VRKIAKLTIALLVLLSGASLIPAVGLPGQGFNWQLYANAYVTIKLFLPIITR
jgi:hypothetical protein